MKDDHLSREQLYSYHDGVLPASERVAVERHLEICSECQAQLARSVAVTQMLKRQLTSTHAPQSLRLAIREQIATRGAPPDVGPRLRGRALALTSIAVLAVLLLALTFAVVFRESGTSPLVTQLVNTHGQIVQDPQRVQMRGNAVELSRWLGDQLHVPVHVPTPDGFSLVGARVEKVGSQLAAHILYRQPDAGELSFFFWRGILTTDNMTPRQINGGQFYLGTQGRETVVVWTEHDLNYACVGNATPQAMLALAADVWRNDKN